MLKKNKDSLILENWKKKLQSNLNLLKEKNLFRTLEVHKGLYDFSSNDYLSLNASGTIEEILSKSIETWESHYIGSTASRLLRGHYEAFEKLETYFCEKLGVESALYFNNGYVANTGTLACVLQARDIVFCDRLVHASILDGIRLSQAHRIYFSHNDLDNLEKKLKQRKKQRKRREEFWIVVESLYSMRGDSPDLKVLSQLAQSFEAKLYIDEAHSFGVYGQGGGLAQEKKLLDQIAISVFPCGKALGFVGAFVCGPKELKEFLINRARTFIYSTALPPFLSPILEKIIEKVFSKDRQKSREHLHEISNFFRQKLYNLGLNTTSRNSQIVPIILRDEKRTLLASLKSQELGYDVRAIRPPTVPSKESCLRVNLQVLHTKELIENFSKNVLTNI